MKKAWGTSDVGQFLVTGPTDIATKPSHFYCRNFRKDVSVLTHGHHELLQNFQGSKYFPRNQRECCTSGATAGENIEGSIGQERQGVTFSEDVIVGETGAVDANLGIMAKVFSFIEVLHLGGRYELMYQLWAQFTLSGVRVNVDITWSRDEVLVSISICAVLST